MNTRLNAIACLASFAPIRKLDVLPTAHSVKFVGWLLHYGVFMDDSNMQRAQDRTGSRQLVDGDELSLGHITGTNKLEATTRV